MTEFKGFGKQALPFLKALDFHQSRDWFKENKALYESELETPRGDLVEALTAAFAANNIPLKGDRKKSVYRIYRDVRFAKDKSPFNKHVSALLTPSGEKREDEGSFFIKIGIEGCFMAAGFYLEGSDRLKEFRNRIITYPDAYRSMMALLAKAKLELGSDGALKRMPKDFEHVSEPDLAAAMKLKHYYVQENIDPAVVTTTKLVDLSVAFMKKAMPLLAWGRAV
ncbi:MAG: TIGR02453 family protein [Rhizobiaceae bacterium]